MNARTAKLLRAYARSTNQSLVSAKREWNATPRNKRGEVRAEMERSLWRKHLLEFKAKHKFVGKEACDALGIPHDTWRSWESMRKTPDKWARIALTTAMRDYVKPT